MVKDCALIEWGEDDLPSSRNKIGHWDLGNRRVRVLTEIDTFMGKVLRKRGQLESMAGR